MADPVAKLEEPLIVRCVQPQSLSSSPLPDFCFALQLMALIQISQLTSCKEANSSSHHHIDMHPQALYQI